MAQLFTNNALTTMPSGLASGAATVTVATGKGVLFPSPTGTDYALLTLVRSSDGAIEIVSLTSRSADTLTITRSQEGTTALTFVANDRIELRITAGWLNSPAVAGLTDSGNLTFTGAGNHISGDFSNGTIASRVTFQTSTAGGNSIVTAIPNGAGTFGAFEGQFQTNATDAVGLRIAGLTGESRLQCTNYGASAASVLTFWVNGAERGRIDTSGNFTISSAAGLGYGTGSGTTGTQSTSRTTSVALSAARNAGAITVFTAAPVVGTWFTFGVTGGGWAATDTLVVSVKSATNTYVANVSLVGAGTCSISMVSITGTASDGPVVNFAVVKAVTA